MGIFILCLIIGFIITLCVAFYDVFEDYGTIGSFFAIVIVGVILSAAISFMCTILISAMVTEGAEVEINELEETYNFNEDTLIKYWSETGYEYSYLKNNKLHRRKADLVEIKIIEEKKESYVETWSYKYTNDNYNIWCINYCNKKTIIYIHENQLEEIN